MTADRVFVDRVERARAEMAAAGVDVLLLSVGPDLPYLTGYTAMPLERLTMLVLPRDGEATLVIPRLEAPRVVERPDVFGLLPWGETEDPIGIVAGLAKGRVRGRGRRPHLGPLRDRPPRPAAGHRLRRGQRRHVAAAHPQGRRRDRGAAGGRRGRRPRRRPAAGGQIAARRSHRGRRLAGHLPAGSSPRATTRSTSPSSPPARTPPAPTTTPAAGSSATARWCCATSAARYDGYCSDITRCVSLGEPPAEVAEAYAVLHEAQQAAVAAAVVGTPCEEVDAVARRIIAAAGYGELFIHRTGHGIGVEEHEDPYIVEGNAAAAGARPRLQRRAGHLPCTAGGACAWRTSWWPPTPGPSR